MYSPLEGLYKVRSKDNIPPFVDLNTLSHVVCNFRTSIFSAQWADLLLNLSDIFWWLLSTKISHAGGSKKALRTKGLQASQKLQRLLLLHTNTHKGVPLSSLFFLSFNLVFEPGGDFSPADSLEYSVFLKAALVCCELSQNRRSVSHFPNPSPFEISIFLLSLDFHPSVVMVSASVASFPAVNDENVSLTSSDRVGRIHNTHTRRQRFRLQNSSLGQSRWHATREAARRTSHAAPIVAPTRVFDLTSMMEAVDLNEQRPKSTSLPKQLRRPAFRKVNPAAIAAIEPDLSKISVDFIQKKIHDIGEE